MLALIQKSFWGGRHQLQSSASSHFVRLGYLRLAADPHKLAADPHKLAADSYNLAVDPRSLLGILLPSEKAVSIVKGLAMARHCALALLLYLRNVILALSKYFGGSVVDCVSFGASAFFGSLCTQRFVLYYLLGIRTLLLNSTHRVPAHDVRRLLCLAD